MRSQHLISAVVVTFFGLTQAGWAAGGGGHAGGTRGGAVGGAHGGGTPGGMSGNHMSPSGQTNNNAQFNPDATRGLDRAQERMSDQGAAHQKATAQEKKQDKAKAAAKKPEKVKPVGDTP
jgi:hypothetical protein